MTSFDPTNPYQSAANENPVGRHQGLDQEIADSWRSVGRWQIFFAIMGLIGSILAVVFVAIAVVFGAAAGRAGAESIISLVVVLPVVILAYLIPSVLLFKASSSARAFASGGTNSILQVVQSQKSFWRYIGILAIVMMAFYAIIIVGAALFEVMNGR